MVRDLYTFVYKNVHTGQWLFFKGLAKKKQRGIYWKLFLQSYYMFEQTYSSMIINYWIAILKRNVGNLNTSSVSHGNLQLNILLKWFFFCDIKLPTYHTNRRTKQLFCCFSFTTISFSYMCIYPRKYVWLCVCIEFKKIPRLETYLFDTWDSLIILQRLLF